MLEDIHELERKYFLCCVRISTDKNVLLFVEVVESLGAEFFDKHGITPWCVPFDL